MYDTCDEHDPLLLGYFDETGLHRRRRSLPLHNDAARVLAVTCSRAQFLQHLPSRRLSLPSQNRSSDTKATKRIHLATDEVDGRGLEGTCSATASEPSLPHWNLILSFVHRTAHLK